MIETAQLSYERNGAGFKFSVIEKNRSVSPSKWSLLNLAVGDTPSNADSLFRCADGDQKPDITDSYIQCTDRFIAELTEVECIQLGLPSVSNCIVKIGAKGLITQPNFEISYRYIGDKQRQVLGATRSGCLLQYAGKEELLLNPYYDIVSQIDEFNRLKLVDKNERFVKWGEIKELLPDTAIVDNQLGNITICRADRVTLDLREHGVFNPLLIKPESHDELAENNKVDYAIPKARQQEFESQFKAWGTVRGSYAIGTNTYIILPKRLQSVLEVVKDYQTMPSERRLAFVSNPQKFINEKLLEHDTSEELESIFVETPEFISQRIEAIGVWEPRLCAYKVQRDGNWTPSDGMRLSFPIDDLLVNFSIEQMKELLLLTVDALDKEIEALEFSGYTIPISLETKNLLIKILKNLADVDKTPNSSGSFKGQVIAPILKDNMDDVVFELIKKDPRAKISRLPQSVKTTSLYEHQKFGVDWLASHWESGSIGALLADDMGLGKTLQSLILMASVKESMRRKEHPNRPILIVAPSGLLQNWIDEAKVHLNEDGLGEVFEAYGQGIRSLKDMNILDRNKLFDSSDWVLTTYETLRDKIKYFMSVDWGVTIFDEAQKIKNPVSRMTEMAKSISSEFTLMLTGTPVENELKDLWCIVDTAQPGLFGSLSHFHNEYALPAESDPREAQKLKSLLVEKSKPALMLRRMKEEHIKGLPDKKIHLVEVPMPPLQAQEYTNIVQEAQAERGNPGSALKFVQQVRRASLIAEEFEGAGINDGVVKRSARLSALVNILDDIERLNEKALIFCEAIDVQEYLAGYLQKRYRLSNRPHVINGKIDGFTRKRYVDEFQLLAENEFNIMLLSPKAGGVGLTITAANHVIHLTRWWNPAVEDQSTDRVFRIGQKKAVNVYIPMAIHPTYQDKSFDLNLARLLDKKRTLSQNALLPGTLNKDEMQNFFSDTLEQ